MTSPFDPFRLDGKTALITGASRGIGTAIAQAFADAGADVWLSGRNEDELTALAAEIPNAKATLLDVTDAKSIKSAFMTVRKDAGKLDILVNNAGIMRPAMLGLSSEADFMAMGDTNLKGSFLCTQLAARLMMAKKDGVILNMTSIMGAVGAPGYAAYSASKAGVIGMTHALAKELAPHNIRVNAIAPGFVETDLTSGIEGENREKALNGIRMGRFGTVEDIANAARFLVSPAAAYITGQVLGVDGAMQI